MGRNVIPISDEISGYLAAHGSAPDVIMRDLIAETRRSLPDASGMQIGTEQSAFMTLLTRIIGVSNAVEVGTFTGMSSLAVARGMRPDGKLICFDVSEEYTAVARRYWERAGVADRVELRIGDARKALRELPSEPHLDMVFIDADKEAYPAYWEELVPRMRQGGVLTVDNTLSGGRVADPSAKDGRTEAIRAFNDLVEGDERVDAVLMPIGDGLTVAYKR
ncbi:MAG TPA: O-methyltransferase [Stackebrandtia sp.]|jgi:caffeoyl-CoA O-methyltransferase|uniref:O-methyltransferase n=1 Tax=Stackebrandtia sp. TaxID=2023065 RepID=UPI002D299C5B|nr:O-methyltransferase [Stackebrandtia sp.]HZE38589.1 O-methyltransferase [Stackebrandtia sp.]